MGKYEESSRGYIIFYDLASPIELLFMNSKRPINKINESLYHTQNLNTRSTFNFIVLNFFKFHLGKYYN